MGRGRPKGSKNKPKEAKQPRKPPEKPKISNDQEFDTIVTTSTKRIRSAAVAAAAATAAAAAAENGDDQTATRSPKKRVLATMESGKLEGGRRGGRRAAENQLLVEEEEEEEEDTVDDPDYGTEDEDETGKKSVRIIRLGTEEVKKYAIINKKNGAVEGEEESDDDDDYDREDRDIGFNEDDPGDHSQEMEEWLDNYTDPEETSLKVSKKYPSKQKFPCPKCDKIWNWPWELRRHLMIHFKPQKLSERNSYKCPLCDKKFQWKRDMKQHERIHTGDKILVCSVCEKQFTTRQALLHHVVVHTGEKPFQCAVCGNKFTQPANLRTHVKKKHNYNFDSNKQNKCEYCGEPHVSIVGLHQHLLEDHPQQVQEERELLAKEKQEKQEEKARREREREQRKMKREKGQRARKPRLKEWELDYEFYIGDGLVRGVDWDRTPSSGEIACGQCDRKFGWRYEIMFHGLCHLLDDQGNAKNRICPECDTPFKVPIGLKHHLITHTGETPFLCLHCWKSFSSHIDLKIHIKKEHLMHLNTKTGEKGELAASHQPSSSASSTPATPPATSRKRPRLKGEFDDGGRVVEEQTSHYVQLDDGTYAEMVEGHEMVKPGHQMLVEDEEGQQLVVVNPSFDSEAQTIVIPEQAETVYVIASQNGPDTIVPDSLPLENLMSGSDNIECVEEDGEKKYIMDVSQRESSIILRVDN